MAGWDDEALRGRYDSVLHMVTTAIGAEEVVAAVHCCLATPPTSALLILLAIPPTSAIPILLAIPPTSALPILLAIPPTSALPHCAAAAAAACCAALLLYCARLLKYHVALLYGWIYLLPNGCCGSMLLCYCIVASVSRWYDSVTHKPTTKPGGKAWMKPGTLPVALIRGYIANMMNLET